MSALNATGRLVRTETKLYVRDRSTPVWGVGFPLIVLVILGSVPALREPREIYGGLMAFDIYVPIMILFNLTILALTAMPTTLAGYRETGVLRRMQTTPVGPARMLVAQLAANLAVALVAVILFLAVAGLGFGVRPPQNATGFVVSWVLSAVALLSMGLLVSALASGRNVAMAIGMVLFFPMMFLAGLWVPIAEMPPLLRDISQYSPLGAGMQAFQDAYQGHFPSALPLVVLAGYAVVCAVGAVRWFRWQ
ncbi:ABC transporter permease [Nonomuraea terrae]|uniref:ABC transporter permease n=1 Tax=Nonomuraea terrae TaxID=2530383 RepID=UPI00379A63E2